MPSIQWYHVVLEGSPPPNADSPNFRWFEIPSNWRGSVCKLRQLHQCCQIRMAHAWKCRPQWCHGRGCYKLMESNKAQQLEMMYFNSMAFFSVCGDVIQHRFSWVLAADSKVRTWHITCQMWKRTRSNKSSLDTSIIVLKMCISIILP